MSQLFTMAPSTFCLAVAHTGGKELVREAPTLPIPEWQDGSFCFPICYYVCSLIEAGKTTAPAGGTIKTYLCYLSELIRYCDDKLDRDFLQLTDWSFSDTVGRLYPSNNFDKPRENQSNRNRTTVHKMVCQWLDFLAFYATLRGRDDFLGEHGVIKAVRVEKTVKKNGKTFRTWVWEHNALAPVDAYRYLAPMSEKHLAQLRRAVRLLESSAFTKRKRLTMLELFSTVGLRRIEASLLRVIDVKSAIDDLNRYLQSASKFADKFAQKVDDMAASARAVFTLKFRMRKQKKGRERIRTTPISTSKICLELGYSRMTGTACGAGASKASEGYSQWGMSQNLSTSISTFDNSSCLMCSGFKAFELQSPALRKYLPQRQVTSRPKERE